MTGAAVRAAIRPYQTVFSMRARLLLQYRSAALAGLATQFAWGLIRMMVFLAFYASTGAAMPMSARDTIAYVWLCQGFLRLIPWALDPEVTESIRNGRVGYELARPLDLHTMWLARALALRTSPVALRCIPMLIVVIPIGWVPWPASVAHGVAFAASIALAVLLSAAMTVALESTLFWTIAGGGIQRLSLGVLTFGSGLAVPLPLLPAPWDTITQMLPFAGLLDTPMRIWTGHLTLAEIPLRLGHQLGWALVLILAGRWLLARGRRHVVIQGG